MSEPTTWRAVTVEVAAEDADIVVGILTERGSLGAVEEPLPAGQATRLVVYFPGERAEAELRDAVRAAFAPLPRLSKAPVATSVEPARDWSENVRLHFKPFELVTGIVVCPSWERYAPRPGEQVISLDPGMAFGTGLHETTRLCTQALAAIARQQQRAPLSLLDVGTGSGILAIVGCRFGMRPVVGIEHDPEALAVARENCGKNGCGDIELFSDLGAVSGAFDVVVANILLGTLLDLRDALARRVSPGGVLLLSGILHDQERELRKAYMSGFEHEKTTRLGEWSCISLARMA